MPLSIVYAGTPRFAVPALEALVASPHRIAMVYTQPDRPAGRGRQLRASAVKERAAALGLPLRQPERLDAPADVSALAALAPELLVVVAYGLRLPPAVLAIPRLGCLNVHASLLPRWRGAAPIQRAILAGDAVTGVAIMRMEAGLDTGPVYASAVLAIDPRDTTATLSERLAARGTELLVAVIAELEAGHAQAVPQAVEGVSHARKLEKREALLDWHQPAVALERRVRALLPWPVAETRWRGAPLKVHEASALPGELATHPGVIVTADAGGLEVATGAGRLRLLAVQLAGRGIVSAREFLAAESARGLRAGAQLGEH